jgi:hypothetical protein
LQRAFSQLVKGLSPEEREKKLEEQATMFLSQAEEPKLAIRINEQKEIDSLACRYLHQSAFYSK